MGGRAPPSWHDLSGASGLAQVVSQANAELVGGDVHEARARRRRRDADGGAVLASPEYKNR
jgi:hypothetical protein